MKTPIFAIVLLICSLHSFSQYSNRNLKWEKGINVSAFASVMTEGLAVSPNFSLSKDKNTFDIGPIIDGIFSDRYPTGKLSGLALGYQCNPNPKGKRFDFFFRYNLYLKREKVSIEDNWFYAGVTEESKMYGSYNFLEQHVGFGFKIKFLKNYFFQNEIGAGYLYVKSNLTNKITENGIITERKSSRGYGGITGQVKLTLGYVFN
jgi:hypothetical protein